jgi:hypothetical protein
MQASTTGTENCPFYPNQITAANEIIAEFQDKHYVQLQAQMQSGKTGCGLYTAFKMIQNKTIQNCFIISGMSDTSIKSQWQNEIRTLRKSYLELFGNNSQKLSDIFNKLSKNVYFNRNLEHISDISEITNSLIIIDEIHYGSTADGSLHRFLFNFGFQDILQGQECSILTEHNIHILSITATRANEDNIFNNEENETVHEHWGRVYMEPGNSYKSIIDYYEQNLIHSNIKLESETEPKLLEILQKYQSQSKYFIIRAVGKQRDYLIQFLIQYNIKKIHFDAETTSRTPFYNIEPTEFTVVIIRGKLRLGNQLNKTYICGVFESSCKMNNDTLLQALPGRVCGYNIPHDINIYVPSTFYSCINEYKEISQKSPTISMTNTKFVNKNNPELKKLCMHNTDISNSIYSFLKISNKIESKILREWRKSQNLWKETIQQKKTLTPNEYDKLTQDHKTMAFSKLEFTRRYGIYKILDKLPGGATGYYIAGNILKHACDDIDLYRSKPLFNDIVAYMKNNSQWLGHSI